MKTIHKPKINFQIEEMSTKLEMVGLFEAFKDLPYSFFLDSSLFSDEIGRYSFIGGFPFLVFKSKGEKIEIIKNGKKDSFIGNPFKELQRLFLQYKIGPSFPIFGKEPPFLGGAVGYIGYETKSFIENLSEDSIDDTHLPDCYFMFVDTIIIADHLKGKKYISSINFEEKKESGENVEFFKKKIRGLRSNPPLSSDPTFHKKNRTRNQKISVTSLLKKDNYLNQILKVKDYISNGDIYEVCLTQKFETNFSGDPFSLYRNLREINPAPFACYINFPEVKILSSSPERFLKLDLDGWAESRPIKGTRPRGENEFEEKRLLHELSTSPKEKAENMMIVDLVRNDLGKACQNFSVKVNDLMKIEKYATLFQMVSTIKGKLDKNKDAFDLIQACFPGGSMTGAPKIRAMEIINELEPIQRGIYSGGVGYIDFRGNMDLSMVIRTILVRDGKAFFHTGGAIVADSDPEEEYQEALVKAKALIEAINISS